LALEDHAAHDVEPDVGREELVAGVNPMIARRRRVSALFGSRSATEGA